MGSYESISVIAVFGYLLLFLMFISAKKNRIIRSYLMVLAASIAWTGGSFLMRIQAWPSYELWYNVSIAGLLYLCYAMYGFVCAFAGTKKNIWNKAWAVVITIICVLNCWKGVFLEAPEMLKTAGGKIQFEYVMTWRVGIMFAVTGGVLVHMFIILIKNCRTNALFKRQMEPTMLGILIMFAGNLALLIPWINGFPMDILAGFINALLMFYGLVKRHLFRLKFLASEGICYSMALVVTLLVLSNLSPTLLATLHGYSPWIANNSLMLVAALVVIVSAGFAYLWRRIISSVFVREELMQKESLQEFSVAVSKSLRIRDIYEAIVRTVKQVTEVEDVYVLMPPQPGEDFQMVFSDSELVPANVTLRADHPMMHYFDHNDEMLIVRDFLYSVQGKAMWSEEKQLFAALHIEYAVALKDKGEIVGVLLLSNKNGKATISHNDVSFFAAIGSIASIAIRNSMLYEKAYREAVSDELTGLYNRKHFGECFIKMFEAYKDASLVLVMFNIDDFKLYNQLYGVCEGDKALQRIAGILKASIGSNGIIARYSGKEFAVLLPDYDVLGAKQLAENISHQVNLINSDKKNYAIKRMTMSVGISGYPYGAQSVREMYNNVDMAVYYVKQHGKNGIRVFDSRTSMENVTVGQTERLPKHVYREYESTIYALTAAIDTKDHYTFRHSNNVAYYAVTLAEALHLNEDTIEIVRQAALLHDVGKIGIPEQILNKEGKLTPDEYEIVKGHVEASIGIIRHLPSLDYVIPAVIGHHERYDGHGYPRQIAGKDIPATARILCIADSFDAMVSKRCYKAAMPLEKVLHILEEEMGRQFDPGMVTIFIGLLKSGKVKIAADEESIQTDNL